METQVRSLGGTWRLLGLGLAVLTMLALCTVQPAGAQLDRVTCGFFETQEDAQAALDADPELALTLDSDGDGIACEDAFETGGPAVVVCNEAIGTLVEVSDTEGALGGLDFPFHLATQAEIAAGTCAVKTPATPVSPGDDGESDKDDDPVDDATSDAVVTLPKTGTGTSGEQPSHAPLWAVLLAMAVGAIAWRARSQQSLA